MVEDEPFLFFRNALFSDENQSLIDKQNCHLLQAVTSIYEGQLINIRKK